MDELRHIPSGNEILIDNPEGGRMRATLLTENGYIVSIVAYAIYKESGEFILHEYLDELGYLDNDRKNIG